MPSWGLSKYDENKLQTTCFYFIKVFLKKEVWELSSSLIFYLILGEKYFSCYMLLFD